MRKISALILAVWTLMAFAGCSGQSTNSIPSADSDKTIYSAQYAQSPQEYNIFLNKEIEPITNQLTTQMGLMKKVANGEYPVADALDSAKSSLSIIQASIAQVDIMQPPPSWDQTRIDVLKCMRNCENDVQTYIGLLEATSLDSNAVKELIKVVEGDFIVITGEFNVPSY